MRRIFYTYLLHGGFDRCVFDGVNTQMCLKVRGAVECLGADDADEWPNGGMCETMTRQISRLTERPSALLAGERFFPRVNSLSTNVNNLYLKRIAYILCYVSSSSFTRYRRKQKPASELEAHYKRCCYSSLTFGN